MKLAIAVCGMIAVAAVVLGAPTRSFTMANDRFVRDGKPVQVRILGVAALRAVVPLALLCVARFCPPASTTPVCALNCGMIDYSACMLLVPTQLRRTFPGITTRLTKVCVSNFATVCHDGGGVPAACHHPLCVTGEFNFEGDRDLGAFLQAAQNAGLMVLLRAGPYMCGEVSACAHAACPLATLTLLVFNVCVPVGVWWAARLAAEPCGGPGHGDPHVQPHVHLIRGQVVGEAVFCGATVSVQQWWYVRACVCGLPVTVRPSNALFDALFLSRPLQAR